MYLKSLPQITWPSVLGQWLRDPPKYLPPTTKEARGQSAVGKPQDESSGKRTPFELFNGLWQINNPKYAR